MPANNLSWYFHVEYFDGAFEARSDMSMRNDILRTVKPKFEKVEISIPGSSSFKLQVEYPGLLAGVGYPHAAGIKGEICAGCSLDYVTGLPYIPGSSIKGLLRSAFSHADYIRELLEDERIDVKKLEAQIFENSDIFMDAYPVDGMCNGVLEIENITPHHSTELGTLAEPTPLTFAKVRPDVIYEFRFVLKDSDLISAENKLKLFKQIILDLGIGAKTNVGFGRFTDEIRTVTLAAQPVPEANKPPLNKYKDGQCRGCGKPVNKINPATQKPYPYCFDCNQKRRMR